MRRIVLVSLGLAGGAVIGAVAAFAQSDLPPGPGQQVLLNSCQNCHGLDQALGDRHDAAGWRGVIDDMISNGASLSDQDESTLVDYLAANYGFGPPPAAGTAPANGAATAPANGAQATTPATPGAAGTPSAATPSTPATPSPATPPSDTASGAAAAPAAPATPSDNMGSSPTNPPADGATQ